MQINGQTESLDKHMSDLRELSPSFERNIAPITEKLRVILPDTNGLILEIGSGSGQHGVASGSVLNPTLRDCQPKRMQPFAKFTLRNELRCMFMCQRAIFDSITQTCVCETLEGQQ